MELKDLTYTDSVRLSSGDALIVVDMQNDFIPGGALPVSEGDSILGGVNELMIRFFTRNYAVVLTQDWHPPGHHSFASSHWGSKPYDLYSAPGLGPVLWPDHCVQGSTGADFHKDLNIHSSHAVIRKGYRPEIDSYSGFLENDLITETGLDGYLKGRGIERIFVCGLAMDYCVFYTAADGAGKGYKVYFITDLTRPVGSPVNSVSLALETLDEKGVCFITSNAIQS